MSFSNERYDQMSYNRVGQSGLKLPAIALGMWHNFGPDDSMENQRALLRTAFDHGVNHFDLADGYGDGYAQINVGKLLKSDFAEHRDELIISTKAGHWRWAGPYGIGGSRKHMLSSLDESLKRLQLDYVDIFYHHVPDTDTPIEETAQALADSVRQGKALHVGISNYYGEYSRAMIRALKALGTPCLINQVPYSMLNRRAAEEGELTGLEADGVGSITFSPLAQGLLSDRYLNTIPADSRAATEGTCLDSGEITPELKAKLRALNAIALERGQTLAQLALCWSLSAPSVASVLIGASRPEQIIQNTEALAHVEIDATTHERIEAILASGSEVTTK